MLYICLPRVRFIFKIANSSFEPRLRTTEDLQFTQFLTDRLYSSKLKIEIFCFIVNHVCRRSKRKSPSLWWYLKPETDLVDFTSFVEYRRIAEEHEHS